MNDTKIEWADDTVNPWWGCVRVSPACEHCYAETLDKRVGGHHWGVNAPRKLRVEKAIGELLKIERRAQREGRPRRVFIASMSDVFEDRADLVEPRAQLWTALHALSGWVVPMLLTKRPAVMAAWAAEHGWPKHAWAGTTVEDQRRYYERVDHLRRVPASVLFLSMEPLLGPVDLSPGWEARNTGHALTDRIDRAEVDRLNNRDRLAGISWVIAGGESGPRARPSHPDWFRSLRDQCAAAGVPFHFKQWGEWAPVPFGTAYEAGDIDMDTSGAYADPGTPKDADPGLAYSSGLLMRRAGKHAAGRLLDGRTHDDFPTVEVP